MRSRSPRGPRMPRAGVEATPMALAGGAQAEELRGDREVMPVALGMSVQMDTSGTGVILLCHGNQKKTKESTTTTAAAVAARSRVLVVTEVVVVLVGGVVVVVVVVLIVH